MTTIKIERFRRECGHNDNCKPRDMIYDFNVFIDGELRAQLHRNFYGRGYELRDGIGWPIGGYDWDRHNGLEVRKKEDFQHVIQMALENGIIPTSERLREQALGQELDHLMRESIERDRQELAYKKNAGAELYDALMTIMPMVDRCAAHSADAIEKAWKAIRLADGSRI